MSSEIVSSGNSPMRLLRLVPQIVRWYVHDHPILVFRTYSEYGSAFRESFSILFLLKTLFSPWKSIKDSYPQKGFNLQGIVETYFMNVTTRCIGACIRLVSILAGIVTQIVLLCSFLVYLIWWFAFPFILIALPFYLLITFFQ